MREHKDNTEPYLTLKQAADAVGAKYWQIQRLVKAGKLPFYRPFNSRKCVLLSELVAYVRTTGSSND